MRNYIFAYCILFSALNLYSQNWKDSLYSARKFYQKGQYQDAVKKYRVTQKLAPKEIDLSDEIGQALYKADEYDQAEKLYNMSSSKKGSAIQKAKTYHNLGNAKMKQKKYEEAVEAYKEALRNNPDDEETRYNLSQAMHKQQSQQKNQAKNQEQKSQANPNQQQNPNQPKQPQNQKKEEDSSGNEQENKSQLSDKKTERMLDDLVKREIETKKKLNGNKSKNTKNNSGKDW